MGGIIVFNNDSDWFVANWAFRCFLKEVIRDHPDDAEVIGACERAELYQALLFKDLRSENSALADRVLAALEKTVARLLAEGEGAFLELGDNEGARMALLAQAARLGELAERERQALGSDRR